MSSSDSNALKWFETLILRLKQGEAEAVIAETRAALEEQPDRIELLISLATAYSYIGQGEDAEPYARRAFDAVYHRGLDGFPHHFDHYDDIAYLGVYEAVLKQGRFSESAHWLEPYADLAVRHNYMWICTAFAYFLAGQNHEASAALERMAVYSPYDGKDSPFDEKFRVSYSYRMMAAYIYQKVLPRFHPGRLFYGRMGTGDNQAALVEWEEEARRNAHNTYGQRLAEILEGLRDFVNHPKRYRVTLFMLFMILLVTILRFAAG
jgi:tetratricopeptide (TPR) repeat protein